MRKLVTVIGLGLVCALSLGAITARAVPPDKIGYTCRKGTRHQFSDAHCIFPSSSGEYEHKLSPVGVLTEHRVGNATTCSETTTACPLTLEGELAGIVVKIEVGKVEGTGTITNVEEGTEAYVTGTDTVTMEEAKVIAPAGKGCTITGGGFTTNTLKITTKGQGDSIRLAPNSGSLIASIPISGCENTALNHIFPLTGSFDAETLGVTLETTAKSTTAQETLLFGGVEAGLALVWTTYGRKDNGEPFTPLSFTTPIP